MDTIVTASVAVLTYQRPADLAAIVPLLLEQAASVPHNVEVLVVDNDPAGGARGQVESLGEGPLLRYVHEPTPGISAARNRALIESHDRRLIVFIDDDERPAPRWLATLLDTFERWPCEAVIGRVEFDFESEPGRWIRAGGFFDRDHVATGTAVAAAASHNLLLDLDFVRAHSLRFDERFGLTGGSDTLFTRQFTDAGGRIVWCEEALVRELVPASRATRQWVIRRAFRGGNTRMRTALALAASPLSRGAVRVRMAGKGTVRILGGAAQTAFGALTGRLAHRAAGVRKIARGAGMLSGVLGGVYTEYRRS